MFAICLQLDAPLEQPVPYSGVVYCHHANITWWYSYYHYFPRYRTIIYCFHNYHSSSYYYKNSNNDGSDYNNHYNCNNDNNHGERWAPDWYNHLWHLEKRYNIPFTRESSSICQTVVFTLGDIQRLQHTSTPLSPQKSLPSSPILTKIPHLFTPIKLIIPVSYHPSINPLTTANVIPIISF